MKPDFTEIKLNPKTDMNLKLFTNRSDWYIIVILIFAGGLLGYLFSFIKQPIYEATALVTTNLQLNKDGPINEFMLDSQINHIGELYYHPAVVQKLIEREAKEGISLDLETLNQIASIERRMLNNLVKIRHTDPNIAARIASNWAEILYETLEEAYPYALEASTAKNTLILLENCAGPKELKSYNNNEIPKPNIDAFCESMTKEDYNNALLEAKNAILENKEAGMGLSEYLNLSQYQPAAIPSKPISFHQGSMVFGGGILGFLLAIGLLILRKRHD